MVVFLWSLAVFLATVFAALIAGVTLTPKRTGFRLTLENPRFVDAQLLERGDVFRFVHPRDHVVVQRAAHKEFRGQIVQLFRVLAFALPAGRGAAFHSAEAGS